MLVDTVRRMAPCGTFRPTFAGWTPGPSLNSNSGYGVSTTSTSPGPLYATALFPDICVLPFRGRVAACVRVSRSERAGESPARAVPPTRSDGYSQGMPDGGAECTRDTLRELSETVMAPAGAPARAAVPAAGAVRSARRARDPHSRCRRRAPPRRRRRRVRPRGLVPRPRRTPTHDALRRGAARRARRRRSDGAGPLAVSRNGAVLVLAGARPDPHGEETVLDLWNIVSLRIQELADHAPTRLSAPRQVLVRRAHGGTRRARRRVLHDPRDGARLAALTAARRSGRPPGGHGDRRARGSCICAPRATAPARSTEEPVTTAFERLRDDLRPLMRFRDDRRAVRRAARRRTSAAERGRPRSARRRARRHPRHDRRPRRHTRAGAVGLRRHPTSSSALRDDGDGETDRRSRSGCASSRDRVHAMRGRIDVDTTPGWGTEMSVVIPLDPPQGRGMRPTSWSLGEREIDVLTPPRLRRAQSRDRRRRSGSVRTP